MIFQLNCLNGPYTLDIRYRNNKVLSAISRFGFCERGLLEHIKGVTPLKCLPFIERIEPYSSQHYSVCFCAIIETAMGKNKDKKLDRIRTVLLELERALHHVQYVRSVIKFTDNIVLYNLIESTKDLLLDSLEEITGRRFYPTAHYFGGLNFSLSHGNIKLIEDTCLKTETKLKEFSDLFYDNPSITSLTKDEAIINNNAANKMTGPFAWINGKAEDLRVSCDYLAYEDIEVQNILGKKFNNDTNCIYTRLKATIEDTKDSLNIIKTIISKNDLTYSNSTLLKDSFVIKAGAYSNSIETPKGHLNMTATINADNVISKISIKTPTETNEFVVDHALNGSHISNIAIAFESLALSPMEADK